MISGSNLDQRLTPKVLVENKICFTAPNSELGVYDTYEKAEQVKLSSDQLLFCGMVQGKKIMHAHGADYHKEFLPHESFIIAPDQVVEIDFPTARSDNPTTCLAIEISKDQVSKVCDHLNKISPVEKTMGEWRYQSDLVHTHHNSDTQVLLNRIVNLFTENHSDRSFLIELAVSELIARLLRHQTRELLVKFSSQQPDKNGLSAALNVIRKEFDQPLNIDNLCQLSCMSRTKFFELFKKNIGTTPQAFQMQIRLTEAAQMIAKGMQITQAGFNCGFASSSHFSRAFKNQFGATPLQYQQMKLTGTVNLSLNDQ